MDERVLSIFSSTPMLILGILLVIVRMYFARRPFHRLIRSFSRIIHNGLRLTSHSVLLAEKKLAARNREVLIAEGMEYAERGIEREFERIQSAINRDLTGFPTLQRNLNELAAKLESDYKESVNVPPELPDWIHVVEGVASIKSTGDSMVANILKEIRTTLDKQHKNALEAYRKASSARHAVLNKMMPLWRGLQNTLKDLNHSVTRLIERASTIDRYMDEYEEIQKGSDKALRRLSSSSLTQFFISGLVMLVAIGGAIINFNLIALPMTEMVGGGSYIGPFKTSDVAGMVIILVEISIGIFLMESLRITRLFPIISSMDDKLRVRMMWVTFIILFILACVESSLAYMRDTIAANREALTQTLAGTESFRPAGSIITTIGQMVMGFILPFALTFVAIPLESFIHSSRTVIGTVGQGLLQGLAFVLRFLGNLAFYAGRMVNNLYDLIIFPALWIEDLARGNLGDKKTEDLSLANRTWSWLSRKNAEKRKQALDETQIIETSTTQKGEKK